MLLLLFADEDINNSKTKQSKTKPTTKHAFCKSIPFAPKILNFHKL